MENEYGAKLDRNGYAPSIVRSDHSHCALCWTTAGKLDRHEIFHGPYREKSKEYGLWITLCRECHDKMHSKDAGQALTMKKVAQARSMQKYGWTKADFIARFGKNYL